MTTNPWSVLSKPCCLPSHHSNWITAHITALSITEFALDFCRDIWRSGFWLINIHNKLQIWALDTRWHNMHAVRAAGLLLVLSRAAAFRTCYLCIHVHMVINKPTATFLWSFLQYIVSLILDCDTLWKKKKNVSCIKGQLISYWWLPLIKTQVSVSKLLQQRPLNNTFGGSVLEEVDENVLQANILLGCGFLLRELIQAGIFLMEGLKERWGIYFTLTN